MATSNDVKGYLDALEARIARLEQSPPQQRRIAFGDGVFDSNANEVRIHIGFNPAQVAVYGATYNPNVTADGWIQFQGPSQYSGRHFIFIASD